MKRNRGKLTFTGTSVCDTNTAYIEEFPQQVLALVYHLIFKKQHISDTGPFIFLGERVGRCMCLGLTDGAVSFTEPVSDSSLCQTQVSRRLLNLSLDDGNRSSFGNMFLF